MDTTGPIAHHPVSPARRTLRHRGFQITDADAPLIEKLSAEQQTAIRATGKIAAIAKALGWPEGTVKSRINRARTALVKLRAEAAGQS